MSSRPFFLLPLCFVSALALNAYAALDPTGVYQDYLEKLDAATPPVAAMATAAADGVYPWSEPKAPEPPPVPDPAPLPDPEPEPKPEEPDSPFTTVDASYFDDALFIGDSHTDGFKDYAGLNNADYLCHNGLTVWSAVEKAEFPGKQTLAQALSGKHYGKIYLTDRGIWVAKRVQQELDAILAHFPPVSGELTDEEHFDVYKHAKSLGLDFVETLCSKGCMSLLKLFTPDRLKVASRDLTNLPLLEVMAETKIPIILSTGMAGKKELDDALEVITRYHNDISILHCVSQYPTRPDNLNLKTIAYLKRHYGQYPIGFSDHTIGIAAPVVAVGMGAEIIEKHITIDRRMKGTDQQGSLGPDGVNRMIRDIRIAEHWLGREELYIDPAVAAAKVKLERSIATNKALHPGDIIKEEDIHLLSPGDGFKWADCDKVVGRQVRKEIPRNEIIYPDSII